ncbi:MAG: threonine/serine dehydratase [Gemmatimonadales bacterium]|nr:threonine/serine dehydratase [Gemmatimonadales bacterium]
MTTAGLARPVVSLAAIRAAADRLVGVANRTPLLPVPSLSQAHGVPVAIKCEQLQPVGAFKIRGACTALAALPAEALARGVITYSSGNHGQALAFAAARLGVRAVIVMPDQAPGVKVAAVRRQGGEVIFGGTTSAERHDRAYAIAADEGLTMVPPFESLEVIAGQGTCGLEILEDWPEVDTILAPVGGGGLLAGISAAAAALRPGLRVVGVEPEGAPKLARALDAGKPVTLERTGSLADGLLPLSIGALPFAVMRDIVHEAVLVSETEIGDAVRFLHRELGLAAEPSGAVTTAAVLANRVQLTGPTALILSGGNVDPDLFLRLVH